MSVFDYTTENIFLFGGFWVFVAALGVFTANSFRRSGLSFWVKIIFIIGGSSAIYCISFWLVGAIFDQRYPNPVFNSWVAFFRVFSMPRLNTLIFHFFFSVALYILSLGAVLLRNRPDKKVKQ